MPAAWSLLAERPQPAAGEMKAVNAWSKELNDLQPGPIALFWGVRK
jgi:hypothetical protein